MDDTKNDKTRAQVFPQRGRPCRMAYAIGNRQPVLCSLISDEPLFFMDFEDADDAGLEESDFLDFSVIDADIADLKDRIEKLSGDSSLSFPEESETVLFSAFVEEMSFMSAPFENATPPDMKFLESTLRKSRFAAALLDAAGKHGTGLVYDSQIPDGLYDRKSGNIHINPRIDRASQILLAARELRRAWQHRNGALINPLTFHPDQAILVNRAQIADLAVAMVRIAWELQLSGEKDIWERLETSSMADLARAFARESFLDFRTLNNGAAQSAVFESWFLSERCRAEDRKLIQLMLADYHGYVFDASQSCSSITADLIAALGSMPFGKNYLAPHVNAIMSDAIFTDVRDRSNANFLWFIKFERSFRETEQELQTGHDIHSRTDKSGDIKNKNIRFGDHEKESEVITLPRGGNTSAPAQTGQERSGNILPFRQHSIGRDS